MNSNNDNIDFKMINICNLADHGVRKYDSDLGRFLCPDAMWEKYISFTPYQYAGNDPINKMDWDGKEILFNPSGGNQKAEELFFEVIDYLMTGGDNSKSFAFKMLDVYYSKDEVLKLDVENKSVPLHGSYFKYKDHITWHPYTALSFDNGKKRSPALNLVEEFSHYFQSKVLSTEEWDDNDEEKTDSQYGTLEERRAKECDVNPIAIELGEGEHKSHKGEKVQVNSIKEK